jgi:hypothetical protein
MRLRPVIENKLTAGTDPADNLKKYWPALKILGEERKDIEQQVRDLL